MLLEGRAEYIHSKRWYNIVCEGRERTKDRKTKGNKPRYNRKTDGLFVEKYTCGWTRQLVKE